MANRLRELILLLSRCLVSAQLWSPQDKIDMDLFKQVQRRATKIFSYMGRLRALGLFSMENVMLWRDLIAAFQYLSGAYKEDGDRLFSRVCCVKALPVLLPM